MQRQNGPVLVAVVLVLILAGGAVAALTWTPAWIAQLVYAAESGKAKAARQQLGVARDFSDAFETVAEALRPAVVSVSSVTRIRPRGPRGTYRAHLAPRDAAWTKPGSLCCPHAQREEYGAF